MKLTEKQKRFIDEYLIDLNATAAARRAGYSKRTADRIGPELLGKTCVSRAITERQKERQQRTEVSQDYVIENLKEIVERSMQRQGDDEYDPRAAAKSLELLGRHLGMFTDKIDVKGELTVSGLLRELTQHE